ncbi:UNKNOWN [Stylonychia lemnae]|uniref:Uncharacterized protein n=1 Tax=Stylonychia lemnae TaxID=5949 RepID=A0A078B5P0_STYLE|nr:UNKNOWN [Stylonychia lemnae]|eukprot:CDW88622.1 UNKNOWN [Stylonychia lemnae]
MKLIDEVKKTQQELAKIQKEHELLKISNKQLLNQNQSKIIQKIEQITNSKNGAGVHINVFSTEAKSLVHDKIFKTFIHYNENSFSTNSQDKSYLPQDIVNQQIAMAQLNENILNEWKRDKQNPKVNKSLNQSIQKLLEQAELIKKEGTSLRVDNSELQTQCDQLKTNFSSLLDKFQEYISENEQDQSITDQIHRQEIQKFVQELNLKQIDMNSKDGQINLLNQRIKDIQDQIIKLQNENLLMRQKYQIHSPVRSIQLNNLNRSNDNSNRQSFQQQQHVSNLECSFNQDELMKYLLQLADQTDLIIKRISQDYQPLQTFQETLQLTNQNDSMINVNQYTEYLIQIKSNLQTINQFVNNICESINDSVELSEFKQLAENILTQYENLVCQEQNDESNKDCTSQQYLYDLHSLFLNLLKCCLNKDIEVTITKRHLEQLMQIMNDNQKGGVVIDLNGLFKQNMEELIGLKMENSMHIQQIEELQRELEDTRAIQSQTINELQNQLLMSQQIDSTQIKLDTQKNNLQNLQSYDSRGLLNQTMLKNSIQSQQFHLKDETQCINCKEMQELYDQLEVQINDSKQKLDDSTNIISSLENQLETAQNTILSIVKIFEKKDIKSYNYPSNILHEFVIEKVKRLNKKYEHQRKNNEEFQSAVLKELESLNKEFSKKKKKQDETKSNKSRERSENNISNMDKFNQLFQLLKEVIQDNAKQNRINEEIDDSLIEQTAKEHQKHYKEVNTNNHFCPRKLSQVTATSSQIGAVYSQNPNSLLNTMTPQNLMTFAERKQSIISQVENLSNVQTQRLVQGINFSKAAENDDTPLVMISERDSKTVLHAQQSIETQNSESAIPTKVQVTTLPSVSNKTQKDAEKDKYINIHKISSKLQLQSFDRYQDKENNSNQLNYSYSNRNNFQNMNLPQLITTNNQIINIEKNPELAMKALDAYYEKVTKNLEPRSKSVEQKTRFGTTAVNNSQNKKIYKNIKILNDLEEQNATKNLDYSQLQTCNYEPCNKFNEYVNEDKDNSKRPHTQHLHTQTIQKKNQNVHHYNYNQANKHFADKENDDNLNRTVMVLQQQNKYQLSDQQQNYTQDKRRKSEGGRSNNNLFKSAQNTQKLNQLAYINQPLTALEARLNNKQAQTIQV